MQTKRPCFSKGDLPRWFLASPVSIQTQIEEIERSFFWLNRQDAERSTDMVQAIPCAFIRNHSGSYYVLEQVRNARKDLSKKLSLIVGGHIDESNECDSFLGFVSLNLKRELEEELHFLPKRLRPIGVMIDHSSIEASRHVAFLHEVVANDVSSRVPEEFTRRSRLPIEFMTPDELAAKRGEFDPWSRMLIEEHICRGVVQKQPRQHLFL